MNSGWQIESAVTNSSNNNSVKDDKLTISSRKNHLRTYSSREIILFYEQENYNVQQLQDQGASKIYLRFPFWSLKNIVITFWLFPFTKNSSLL